MTRDDIFWELRRMNKCFLRNAQQKNVLFISHYLYKWIMDMLGALNFDEIYFNYILQRVSDTSNSPYDNLNGSWWHGWPYISIVYIGDKCHHELRYNFVIILYENVIFNYFYIVRFWRGKRLQRNVHNHIRTTNDVSHKKNEKHS